MERQLGDKILIQDTMGAEGREARGDAFSQKQGAGLGRHPTRAVYNQLKIFLAIVLREIHVFWTVKTPAQDEKAHILPYVINSFYSQ